LTKARDLANLISGGFTEADIPNLSASKITSGTFADARIAASNVSQHATSFDDNKIVNDISTLGLRVHTQENLNASNTNSASFDVFQDSSGITNLTNATRDSNEFIATQSSSTSDSSIEIDTVSEFDTYFTMNDTAWCNYGGSFSYAKSTNYPTSNNGSLRNHFTSDSSSNWNNGSSRQGTHWIMGFDFGPNKLLSPTKINWTHRSGYGGMVSNGMKVWASNDLSTITFFGSGTYTQTNPTSNVGQSMSTSTFYRYVGFSYEYSSNNIPDTMDGEIDGTLRATIFTTNATGSFEGNAITASSTNKMGAVITYQDNAGTNTLNTDIVLKLSADNGSNYSTATLTALPDFATGIKMAKVNDLSVTAGTQLKYKIEFANQASGSKEARIRGVSLQY
jgi:hypothetical protein